MTNEEIEQYLNNEVYNRVDYDIYSTLIGYVQEENLALSQYAKAKERICENCSHCQRIIDNEVYCDYFASFFEYENNNVKFGCARLI